MILCNKYSILRDKLYAVKLIKISGLEDHAILERLEAKQALF